MVTIVLMWLANQKRLGPLALAVFISSILTMAPSSAAQVSFPDARPFKLFVPTNYDPAVPAPLILALHGFGQSSAQFEKYLGLTAIAQSRGILYVHPDGTKDKVGTQFWNATPECCDFQSPKVNDDAYLMSIIDEVSAKYAVDPQRIYILGHSNGGFMANRMACNHADRIAAIVDMAGGSFTKVTQCSPQHPISILEVWGTADETYKGNHILGKPIPGAVKTIATWAGLNQCSAVSEKQVEKIDLDPVIKGRETTVFAYTQCSIGISVELWSIAGANHVPHMSSAFASAMIDFLLAHPKATALTN